jgi:hypothetical protein
MTKEQTAEFEAKLKKQGWSYVAADGEFRSGGRRVEWEEVMGLIPGTTYDFLMAYELAKHQEWQATVSPRTKR